MRKRQRKKNEAQRYIRMGLKRRQVLAMRRELALHPSTTFEAAVLRAAVRTKWQMLAVLQRPFRFPCNRGAALIARLDNLKGIPVEEEFVYAR